MNPSISPSPDHFELNWLPATALEHAEPDAALRSWLTEGGVLTRRLRALCGARFHMRLIGEHFEADERVREIILCCGEQAWVYAQTRIPRRTLERNDWLRTLGGMPLGEAFESQGLREKSELEFAQLAPSHPVIQRALHETRWPSRKFWMRRAHFVTRGGPFLVQEVFSPDIGRPGMEKRNP